VRVTACIVGFRNADDVVACVARLGESTHRPLEVVICENGGAEAFALLQARLPAQLEGGGQLRIVDAGGNLGYAGGFNRCLAEAPDADAWWLVNPDAEPATDALALMIERLARGDCGMVGSTLLLGDGRVQAFGGRFRHWLARAESIGHGAPGSTVPDARHIEATMNYVLGASMLVDRHFLARVGPMRDDYFLYAEEVEWCVRGLTRGEKLGFAPGARVLHRQGTTTGSANTHHGRPWLPVYLDERNRLHVVRDTRPLLLPVATVMSFMLILLRYARRGAWTQTGYAIQGWMAGIANRRGVPARMRAK